ncbi:chlorohydrolase [Streptococcus pneumoniae]|nr:chlorohydrolase [Streptococcus pneumoniae]
MGKLLTRGFHILFVKRSLYSMKIKEQTRKLAAGCSKHCFEVVDRTDEVSNHIYGNVTLTWFEEIFEEYYISKGRSKFTPTC